MSEKDRTQKCGHCKQTKTVFDFYPSHRKTGGTCKECSRMFVRRHNDRVKKGAEYVKEKYRLLAGRMFVVRGFVERVLGDNEY